VIQPCANKSYLLDWSGEFMQKKRMLTSLNTHLMNIAASQLTHSN